MTFRLCIFGNSHIAALKDGWSANPGRWQGLSADFVGAHRDLLMQTEIRDGHLTPVTDDARDAFNRLAGIASVDLSAYDGFVVAGCAIGVHCATSIWREMRWAGLPSLVNAADIATMRPRLVSRAAARATLEDRLTNLLGLQFTRLLRSATDRPIWIVGRPRVSAVIRVTRPRKDTFNHTDILRNGDTAAVEALFEDAAPRAAAASGAEYLLQPRQTVVNNILTARRFMDGAFRLSARPGQPQPPDDVIHANADYGALVLDALAERIAQPAAAAG